MFDKWLRFNKAQYERDISYEIEKRKIMKEKLDTKGRKSNNVKGNHESLNKIPVDAHHYDSYKI